MNKSVHTYRCPAKCPIGKQCFVLKVEETLKKPITVLQKCPAKKSDIRITIGGVWTSLI